jgi:hypothetical protein
MLRQRDVAKVGRGMEVGDRGRGRGTAEVSRPTQGRVQIHVGCRVPELVHLEYVYLSYR